MRTGYFSTLKTSLATGGKYIERSTLRKHYKEIQTLIFGKKVPLERQSKRKINLPLYNHIKEALSEPSGGTMSISEWADVGLFSLVTLAILHTAERVLAV